MTSKLTTVLSLALAAIIFTACGTARKAALPAAGLPIVQKQISQAEKTTDLSALDTLSLELAISLALENNPELHALKTETQAFEARTKQENLLPNPELDIELENFSGSGPLSKFKSTETTLAIGQLIELGGKRSKRTRIAELQSDMALWQHEMKRLDIITRVRGIFTQIITAQMKIELDKEILEISRQFKLNIEKRVKAGRLSSAELARAQVELSNATLALRQSERELTNLKRLLAAMWAAQAVDFTRVSGSLTVNESLPQVESLVQAIDKSPQVIQQSALIKRQRAETELAEALAIPDPVISAGYRRFNDTNDQAFVAGLSIPLPISDRNQGGRQEAKLRVKQGEQQLQGLKTRLNIELKNRLETVHNISDEIEMMKNIILPEAQKAHDIIYQNYQLGKYALIDVLDAQRQLFDTERRYLDARSRINLQFIELEGLLGQAINSL